MSLEFNQIRLLVTEFSSCFRFYRDILGFAVNWGDENSGYADFKTGNILLALFDRKEMAIAIGNDDKPIDAITQDKVTIVFIVENVDKTYKELQQKGVKFIKEPIDHSDWGVRTAHFRDPDGNLIEINCPIQA